MPKLSSGLNNKYGINMDKYVIYLGNSFLSSQRGMIRRAGGGGELKNTRVVKSGEGPQEQTVYSLLHSYEDGHRRPRQIWGFKLQEVLCFTSCQDLGRQQAPIIPFATMG